MKFLESICDGVMADMLSFMVVQGLTNHHRGLVGLSEDGKIWATEDASRLKHEYDEWKSKRSALDDCPF